MVAANESQGLKIAVAVFVALTVILAVTSYFMYSNASDYYAKMEDAKKESDKSQQAAKQALTQIQELRTLVAAPYANVEDFDAVKTGIKKDYDKVSQEVHRISADVKKMIDEYHQAHGTDPKVDDLAKSVDQLVAAYDSEPNKSLTSSLDRLRELLSSQAMLTTAFALDNVNLRNNLEGINKVTQNKADLHDQDKKKAQEDLNAEHGKHEQARSDLVAKLDKLQTDNSNLARDLDQTKRKAAETREDLEKKLADLRQRVSHLNQLSAQTETVMDSPDGTITYVDYKRREAYTNLTRRMGARPHMIFAVFNQGAPIPNDHPKGTIELVQVDDRGSLARIIKGKGGNELQAPTDVADPIRIGDLVYSPAWSPNNPERFAMIGKIDLNRDGKDDRADLKRLIEAAGGMV